VTIGVVVAFLQYVRRFFYPLRAISMMWGSIQSAIAGSERIFELLDDSTELKDEEDAIELPVLTGRVEFKNVDFSYNEGEPVLKDVSLLAEPGKTISLVGPTGAGKTTIISLIGRLYEIDSGSVQVDGHDVRKVSRPSLRGQMGLVLQDTFLFSDTVMENIRYGRLDATDDEVVQAAKLSNAHDFISQFPEGYQTKVTEQGSNLSRGQRQLISIARAVLADPRILILDEATSSVDTRTERLIQEALERLLEGRTSFVVAHRLSTIQRADELVVIDNGIIVERGTHEELMAKKGTYHHIYMSQFQDADLAHAGS
jgi:ABC-type multidrug transport system fused ATPase/permease subunit